MTDTARIRSDNIEPVLDLDAMLLDLHNEFKGEPGGEVETGEASTGNDEDDVGETSATEASEVTDSPDLDQILPPGYVKVGDQVVSELEARAFLGLNERIKKEPGLAGRLQALLDGKVQTEQAPEPDALPVHIDPDDQQAVFLFRQQQRIDAEVAQIRARDQAREQQSQLQARELREAAVRDAFREGMREFKDDHPTFDLADLNGIAQRAASMRLLENPEAVGGTLKAGIVAAFEAAMYATPEYREKATAGASVPTKEQRSTSRKQKSSALSSSTGSVVRTQSQEQTPTTRRAVIDAGLEFLRSGAVTD